MTDNNTSRSNSPILVEGRGKDDDVESGMETPDVNSVKSESDSKIPPPDTGYAWVIMVACLFNMLLAFGSFNAFGIFQTYYLEVKFRNTSAETIDWIGTASGFITFTGGLTAGPIIKRIGIRNTSLLGSVICATGLLLASFSNKIWQYILTQGLIFGYGTSLIVNVSLSVPALWFDKYRGLAIAVVSSGGGFGALILIPIINKVLNKAGIGWAFRTLCFLYLLLTGIPGLLLKPRSTYQPSDTILDLKMLKNPITIALCLVGFFMTIGFYIPSLYFPTNFVEIGRSNNQSIYFIMIFCSASGLSRIGCLPLTKYFKPTTIMFVCHMITGIIMMAMWYPSKKFSVLMAFYVLMGFVSIPYMALGPALTAKHFPKESVSQVNALTYLAMGIAILISFPSVGVAFDKIGHKTDFKSIVLIGAIAYFISAICVIYLRYTLRGTKEL
ncbi:putative transporter MCH2 [Smittium mucronatum]|uniref:Putative transporter MCH2 n=1 Tax=Smittium mucronatum TaxID=133383 RepID=A0A1R0GWP7_9FUNG|nr:putative transporter MCH2 [Smittium mucronatum]